MRKPVARRTLGVSGVVSAFVALIFLLSLTSTVWALPGQDASRLTLPPPEKEPVKEVIAESSGEPVTVAENVEATDPVTGETTKLPVAISVPEGAVSTLAAQTGGPVSIEAKKITAEQAPPPPPDKQPMVLMEINVVAGGEVKKGVALDKPIQITIQVPQNVFDAVKGNLSQVGVLRYDEGLKQWVTLRHVAEDIATRTITVEVQRFSVFAVTVPKEAVQAVQPTPTPTPTPTPAPPPTGDIQPSAGLLTALAVLGFLMVLTGGYLLRRRTA